MLEIKPKKFKVHSLTGRITPKFVQDAWKAVKRNNGAAGIDRMTVAGYHGNREKHLNDLMVRLKTRGSYKSPPLKRVFIPKAGSTTLRPLGIPTVDARCAQEVVRRLIAPIFETKFHENSFGFRNGRSCHQAVKRALEYIREGNKFVVDIDIKGFFDNIPHELILRMLRAEIADGNILDIIESFLGSGVSEDGKIIATTKGTPQGGVISPLLANIVLDYLDWKLDAMGYKFVRYADDIVILCKTKHQAENALILTQSILGDLGLECSPEKTKIGRVSEGFQFLGFDVNSRTVGIREKSREKFERKIDELTIRKHNLDANVFRKLNQVIRGTVNYFCTGFSHVKTYFERIDKRIRRRIRSMKYKSKSDYHNKRLHCKHIKRRGLYSCVDACQDAITRWYSPKRGKQIGVAH